jgi:predicted ATPase
MIKELQIQRFKGIRNTPKLQIGKINLLTGANGRGKSSLCQVLLTLAQTWDAEAFDALLTYQGKWLGLGSYADVHYAYDSDSTIVFQIQTDDAKDYSFKLQYDQSRAKPTLIELANAEVNGVSIMDNSGNSMGDFNSDFNSDFDVSLSRLTDYPSLMALRNIHYVSASRLAASYREPLDESAEKLRPDGSNVLSVLWNHRETGCLKELEDLMNGILDGAKIHFDISANELVFTLNSAKDDMLFKPVNVGYGHGYILSVIATLLIAKENDTLIVENPEAHLHPAAQAKLMNVVIDYANRKNLQVFIETHSDHILNTALVAVKDRKLTTDDFQVMFFSGKMNADGHFEATVQNLEVTNGGHIIDAPSKFFEQYATDLEKLYL